MVQVKMSEFDMRAWPGRTHRYLQVPVLYPFGHGLSYTTFAYSHLSAQHSTLPNGQRAISATVRVQNTGTNWLQLQPWPAPVSACSRCCPPTSGLRFQLDFILSLQLASSQALGSCRHDGSGGSGACIPDVQASPQIWPAIVAVAWTGTSSSWVGSAPSCACQMVWCIPWLSGCLSDTCYSGRDFRRVKLQPGEGLTVDLHIDGDNLENLLVNQSTGVASSLRGELQLEVDTLHFRLPSNMACVLTEPSAARSA